MTVFALAFTVHMIQGITVEGRKCSSYRKTYATYEDYSYTPFRAFMSGDFVGFMST